MKISSPTFRLTTVLSVVVILCVSLSDSLEYENPEGRGPLDTLYSLRSKLHSTASAANPGAPTPVRKESRGYSFHYSPSSVTSSYDSASFSSRAGKVDVDSSKSTNKLKSSGTKSWSKYAKLAYKTIPSGGAVNSFNVHQKSKSATESALNATTQQPTVTPSSTTTTKSPLEISPLGPIESLSQGINTVMTTVLTQRLMSLLDQDVPEGIFNPLRHIVATGNRMVEFWDKKTNARDGKKPGIVEMFGYGLNQLKKFRDGQAVKATDPVANLTSASKTLIQGMITVKKLTNRVLGYDTANEVAESRGGGYGHDSYGHGGHGQYMSYGTFDSYAILATLGFGVFLFNVIFNLLNNNNMATGRSLDVSDFDIPLALSDVIGSSNFQENFFGTPTVRHKRDTGGLDLDGEDNLFYSVVDKLDGMYKTYNQISEKPSCARLYMCRLAVDEVYSDGSSILSPLYIYGLGHWTKDKSSIEFVESIKRRVASGEEIDCNKIVKDCVQKKTNNFI